MHVTLRKIILPLLFVVLVGCHVGVLPFLTVPMNIPRTAAADSHGLLSQQSWELSTHTDRAGCHVVMLSGYVFIDREEWAQIEAGLFGVYATVEGRDQGVVLPVQALTFSGYFQAKMPIYLGTAGDYLIRAGTFVLFPTRGARSTVELEYLDFVWDRDGTQCDLETPGL